MRKKIIEEISGAGAIAVSRWERQYLAELDGAIPNSAALTSDKQKQYCVNINVC